MTVTIRPGLEWRSLARRLGDKKLISAATIKAVNTAGKTLRQEIPEILMEIFSAPAAALKIRGRAAHKTQRRDPRYTLSFDQAIQLARLRAKARVFSKARRGHAVGRFILRQPGGEKSFFSAVSKEGKGRASAFKLHAAGDLPERFLGGIRLPADALKPAVSRRRFPALGKAIDRAGDNLADAMAEAITNAIRQRRGR